MLTAADRVIRLLLPETTKQLTGELAMNMVKASSGIAEFERVCFGDLLHVSILDNVVCISPALERWVHCCPDSLFRELTLANAIDTAVVVDGLSLYPCQSEIAALCLARYFADVVDCVSSFCM